MQQMRSKNAKAVSPQHRRAVAVRLLVILLGTYLLSAGTGVAQAPGKSWNVVLVSIDTLRADHVGAYGYAHKITPNLDALAKAGVLFDRVYSPVPLTLPAHASLLTGQYPQTDGVRDNGEALSPAIPTLAEGLKSAGFATAAFVSAFVLDRRFGLSRGFEEYWGEFSLYRHGGADPGDIQLRGDLVEAAAEDWIGRNSHRRFFAFVHFYDLHGPYHLPAEWRRRFPDSIYDGEVAYVDDLIGKLWASLEKLGLADHTMFVVTADHGEALGGHGEQNHGFFVYSETVRIPLIFRLPSGANAGWRAPWVARLIDVAPTICALTGVQPLASFQGRSLSQEINRVALPPLPAYSETLYPFRHFHTAPLYALRTGQYTYISAPQPELYRYADDQGELHNLASRSQAIANTLKEELNALTGTSRPAHDERISPANAEALKSLGYVAASSGASSSLAENAHLADPKSRIATYRKFQKTLALESEGKTAMAAVELEEMSARAPDLVAVQIEAGLARQSLHQDASAVPHFRAVLRTDPANALAHFDLGVSLSNLGDLTEAEKEFTTAIKLQPWYSRAYTALGLTQAHAGRPIDAIAALNEALRIDPTDFDAWLNRGKLRMMTGQRDGALGDFKRAVTIEPESPSAHEALGTYALYQGDLDGARDEYEHALKLAPGSSVLHADLGAVYRKMGRNAEAQSEFRLALKLDPKNADAQAGLANAP